MQARTAFGSLILRDPEGDVDLATDRRRVLIDRLYEAAFDDQAFFDLGFTISRLMDTERAMVTTRQGRNVTAISMTGAPELTEDYLNHYFRIDPWTPAIMSLAPGRFAFGEELIPQRTLENSEFYVDYALPMGVMYPMCGRLPLDAATDLMVAVSQTGSAQFDEESRKGLAEISTHVLRIIQMRRKLEAQSEGAALRDAVLNAVSFGLGLVGQDGRLLFANKALEDLARAGMGIKIAAGRLTSLAHAETDRLAQLILEAAQRRRSGACSLTGPAGLPCVSAIVSPAGPNSPGGPAGEGRVVVAVSPLQPPPRMAHETFGRLFGLSAAEAEIVAALWGGASLQDIAARRGVKPTTLKTQFETVYRKTGVGGQRELLLLLGGLPRINGGG